MNEPSPTKRNRGAYLFSFSGLSKLKTTGQKSAAKINVPAIQAFNTVHTTYMGIYLRTACKPPPFEARGLTGCKLEISATKVQMETPPEPSLLYP